MKEANLHQEQMETLAAKAENMSINYSGEIKELKEERERQELKIENIAKHALEMG